MTTMYAGPYVPAGYDSGFPFDSSPEEGDTQSLLPPYDFHCPMTHTYPAVFAGDFWTPHSPTSSRGHVARLSPGRDSDQAAAPSQASASLSPTGPIFTPTSTLLDDEDIIAGDTLFEDAATSPDSNTLSAEGYVHIAGPEDDVDNGSGNVTSQPPLSSGVNSSHHAASGSSHQQFLPTPSRTVEHSQWQRLSSSPSNTSMEDSFAPYTSSADLGLSLESWAEADLLPNASDFSTSFTDQTYGTSFKTSNHGVLRQLPSKSNGMSISSPQTLVLRAQASTPNSLFDAGIQASPDYTGAHLPQQHEADQPRMVPFTQPTAVRAVARSNVMSQGIRQQHMVPSQAQGYAQSQQINVSVPQASVSVTAIPSSHATKTQQQRTHLDYASSGRLSTVGARGRQKMSWTPNTPSTIAVRGSRTLVKRDPGHFASGPVRSLQTDRTKRGGRQRDSHLSTETRQKSHEMRKKGACWRCAIQRDQCDHGEPCQRCLNRAAKGQIQYFDCDRSKLPDFVHEFLPSSISEPIQKQKIEDLVNSEVLQWDKEHQLDLYLTVQYGEPLVWKCYEFRPRTPELLTQFQFIQDPGTGQSIRHIKYSPPFGLLKIETSDDHYLNAYLDRLMLPKYLRDFPWCFYEEEKIKEPRQTQARLLDFMCQLYLSTTDPALIALLKDIIRMLIITFIMGHTFFIVESNLPTVISSIRHTTPPAHCPEYTSPRLANRQMKFFFGVLRAQIYGKILKWQQQTFHTGGKKERTWIHSFCVMLGFAMVHEEVQRTLSLHAETVVEQGTMSPNDAAREAETAFDRIDEKYKFLIGLFLCKYRDKTWSDDGSFGRHTPNLTEPAQVRFLYEVKKLLVEEQHHFKSRENVPFGSGTQCFYTGRQTARFLLPFLENMTFGTV